MAGTIYEFFGYRAEDKSDTARAMAAENRCPFLNAPCTKELRRDADSSEPLLSGACTIKQVTGSPVICCPHRLYGDNYAILRDVVDLAFGGPIPLRPASQAPTYVNEHKSPVVAVFGHRWGGELHLPAKDGVGSYFVDWVLALIDAKGKLEQFVAVEIQTIDTTGNYRASRVGLLSPDREIVKSTVGLNWENVNKRILPQLVYKGQVLQREELCEKGLFFVCPTPVFDRIMGRLGGQEALPRYKLQPAALTFMPYDLVDEENRPGTPLRVEAAATHTTTVYKVQEAFNNVTLPAENVYKQAIELALAAARPSLVEQALAKLSSLSPNHR